MVSQRMTQLPDSSPSQGRVEASTRHAANLPLIKLRSIDELAPIGLIRTMMIVTSFDRLDSTCHPLCSKVPRRPLQYLSHQSFIRQALPYQLTPQYLPSLCSKSACSTLADHQTVRGHEHILKNRQELNSCIYPITSVCRGRRMRAAQTSLPTMSTRSEGALSKHAKDAD